VAASGLGRLGLLPCLFRDDDSDGRFYCLGLFFPKVLVSSVLLPGLGFSVPGQLSCMFGAVGTRNVGLRFLFILPFA